MKPNHILYCILFCSLLSVLGVTCKKFVTIPPPKTQLISSTVFTNDATAVAALTGIYSRMISSNGFASGGSYGITLLAGLSADELTNYSTSANYVQFYTNTILPSNVVLNFFLWQEAYQYIYSANAIIEGLKSSSGVTGPVKQELIGEALFIRAFCHFYLVNLFGDIPYATTTDYKVNNIATRMPQVEVYQHIVADLKEAQNLLASNYSYSNGERIRPNKWAATALLARVYLYQKDWPDAEMQATAVINSGNYNLTNDLNAVFLKNSSEAIWQLMPVLPGYNTPEGYNFNLTSAPTTAALSNYVLDAFEPGDNRKATWVRSITVGSKTYYYPHKYQVGSANTLTEYYMVLRLAEQYLIRAEARAEQNNISGAQDDLNMIRNRAGLGNTTANIQSSLLSVIQHERQAELFCEWGNRWLDLKRTMRADQVLNLIKRGWKSSAVLYPIPQNEIQNNQNITQNAGY